MIIRFNGKKMEVNDAISLEDILLQQASIQEVNLDVAVVAVNLQFIHKAEYGHYFVKEGDDIELLTAVVGG